MVKILFKKPAMAFNHSVWDMLPARWTLNGCSRLSQFNKFDIALVLNLFDHFLEINSSLGLSFLEVDFALLHLLKHL